MTAWRMISGLVSKYRNGLRFVIRQGHATALPRRMLVSSDSTRAGQP
jgi:hypothetical protein